MSLLPKTTPIPRQTLEQLQKLSAELRDKDEKLSTILADKGKLDEELQRLRLEVAEARRAATVQPDTHDYSEAETRAIRRIAEAFEQDHDRKALIVMAADVGKTRTVIALCDLLMRCNWAK